MEPLCKQTIYHQESYKSCVICSRFYARAIEFVHVIKAIMSSFFNLFLLITIAAKFK